MSHILLIGSLAESLVNFRGDLIQHLLRQGHSVTAVAPSGPPEVDAQIASWGARRLTVRLDRTGTSIASDLRLVVDLARCFAREKPDVVLAYTIKPVVYGALAARWCKVPKMAAMITGLGFAFAPPSGARQRLVRLFARLLYRAAMRYTDTIFFQNPDDEADFRRSGLIRPQHDVVRIQGSGVNLQRFAAQPIPTTGAMRFLMIARLLVDKGVREYVAAAALVRREHPGVEFHLVGPFDDNPSALPIDEITAAVQRGDIVFHGPVQDVRAHLANCHVYVLPSYREGMPRSVLEAMATGRAVITTDVPGCRETVVEGENGLLVPARDSGALAAAMSKLLFAGPDAVAAMGKASRALAASKYDVFAVNDTIADALNRCSREH